VTIANQAESAGNLLMIHPLLYEQIQQNPFKSEDRKFPVDYSFKYNKTLIFSYQIPSGYQVETLPKSINMSLPDNKAVFMYKVDAVGNKVQVIRKFILNNTMFIPDDYKDLKEFYNQMVNKEAEFIVLKKSI